MEYINSEIERKLIEYPLIGRYFYRLKANTFVRIIQNYSLNNTYVKSCKYGAEIRREYIEFLKQSLRDYKRSLIDLCQEIVRLDNMFISLCENYIYPTYDSFKDAEGNYLELDATALRNQKNLANLKSVVATITPAIEYLNAFDGYYTQHDTDKIFTTLNSYAGIEIVGSSA